MSVTDHQLLALETRDHAVRELAAEAKAEHADKVSTRVAIARSASGDWRVVHHESELGAEVSVEIQVFRGETVDSGWARVRIAWATRKVRRIVAERQGR